MADEYAEKEVVEEDAEVAKVIDAEMARETREEKADRERLRPKIQQNPILRPKPRKANPLAIPEDS